MNKAGIFTFIVLFVVICPYFVFSQSAMSNVYSRKGISLNGLWNVLVDPTGIGNWREVWKERKPEKKSDFFEYSFEGGPQFNVPADFNSQMAELTYIEGTVWYKKTFEYFKLEEKRLFIYFGAVNYISKVYLNGEYLGSHEGGFTPFQFEITDKVNNGINKVVVMADNTRNINGLPGLGFDWFNYGGITRDVFIVETNGTYIDDYNIQLKKGSYADVAGWIKLNGGKASQKLNIRIPELKINKTSFSDGKGYAPVSFNADFVLWSPENPKLYEVIIECETDTIIDKIGFRSIETKDGKVFLNGKDIFLKAINIHEENPIKKVKACTEDDALLLLNWAKDLGCNMVRLAHYPHNEYMVRLAEKMGLMVWDEIPIYQHIEFSTQCVPEKMSLMMKEMIKRDRNRCSVVIWSLSNETYSFTPNRDNALIDLTKECRTIDSTRLITSVINNQGYNDNTFNVWDTLYRYCDIISLNEYIGWYVPWQGKPEDVKWKIVYPEKPVFISEFGGEALYGSNYGPKDEAAYWSEEYQENIFKDQVKMFATLPNLVGVCPWLLVDYSSPGRMHPVFQQGWNRKGLLSDKGEKKKAWYIIRDFFSSR